MAMALNSGRRSFSSFIKIENLLLKVKSFWAYISDFNFMGIVQEVELNTLQKESYLGFLLVSFKQKQAT